MVSSFGIVGVIGSFSFSISFSFNVCISIVSSSVIRNKDVLFVN